MEGELWKQVYRRLEVIGKKYRRKYVSFSDRWIAQVYMWAVLHDRPVSWACDQRNWPADMDWRLPTPSTMSRRLRTDSVQRLLAELESICRDALPSGLWKWVDAKPLPIGNCSKDRQAGYGRSGAGMGKGYKLFAICDSNGTMDAWRIGPMNKDEKTMAHRLMGHVQGPGYLAGDGEYDASRLYAAARSAGLVLVASKRGGPGLGHHKQRPERLRSIELQNRQFGRALLRQREGIERIFAHLTCGACALQPLPAWVRTHRRVELWVRGKIIVYYLKRVQIAELTA